jgi:peptide/nickel transport system ATP-binding protein
MSQPLIEIRDLKKYFDTSQGPLHAVDNINLSINKGQTLGVVGESGCGKSTLGRAILRLVEPTSGEILYKGENIVDYDVNKMRNTRRDLQMIFQDPYSSLNPRMTVGETIAEPLKVNGFKGSREELSQKIEETMETVGLSNRLINSYPHELDGGRRQRIGLARAIILEPEFIVCDEPVSALDVSIQAQILNLLMDLQDQKDFSYLFITHDLSVVKHISDEIVVMYIGQCIERANAKQLFANPLHPYSIALLHAILAPNLRNRGKPKKVLRGEVTSPINPIPGCRFAPRCAHASERCLNRDIELKEVEPGHWVACTLFE